MPKLNITKEHILQVNSKDSIENILSTVEDDISGDIDSIINIRGKDEKRLLTNFSNIGADLKRTTGCFSVIVGDHTKKLQKSRYGTIVKEVSVGTVSGIGSGLTCRVQIGQRGKITATVVKHGTGYAVNDDLLITGLSLNNVNEGDIPLKVFDLTINKTLKSETTFFQFTTSLLIVSLYVENDGAYEITADFSGDGIGLENNYTVGINENDVFGFGTNKTVSFTYKPTFTNIATITNGIGTGLTVDVEYDYNANIKITPFNSGTGYKPYDILQIDDSLIGGLILPDILFNIKLLYKPYRCIFNVPSYLNLSRHARIVLSDVSATNDDVNTIYTIRCQEIQNNHIMYQKKGLNHTIPYEIAHSLTNSQNLQRLTIDLSDSITNIYNGYAKDIIYTLQLKIIDYVEVKDTFSDNSKHCHEMMYYS